MYKSVIGTCDRDVTQLDMILGYMILNYSTTIHMISKAPQPSKKKKIEHRAIFDIILEFSKLCENVTRNRHDIGLIE